MRRLLMLALAALLALSPCLAQGEEIAAETVQEIVQSLFSAAAGTTYEQEAKLRKDMTPEQLLERDAQNAAHRAQTLPWLKLAFGHDPALEPQDDAQEPQTPPWTLEDGYAAIASREAGQAYLAHLAAFGGVDAASCMAITQEICGLWLAQIDHEQLAQINGEYVFWISAPGTKIDYPVVQSDNNDYYLNHLFNKKRNASGALFVDYRNLPEFQDPNTLIYGHHMRNDSMFGTLTDYYDPGYYDAHPYMILITPTRLLLIELFAAYVTDSEDHCYDIALSDEEDMRAFVEEAERKSNFRTGVEVDVTDHLVTLSTCAYAFENARYIAIGRLNEILLPAPEDEAFPGEAN